jgi:hypothetical protein
MHDKGMSIHAFHRRETPDAPLTWSGKLALAHTEHEVIMAARDFLAGFTPAEIAKLPEPCRPGKIVDANDITSYAFNLVRHDCGDQAETARLVMKLADFFSHASIRLSQILAKSNTRDEDDDRRSA